MKKKTTADVKQRAANDGPNSNGKQKRVPKAPKPEQKFIYRKNNNHIRSHPGDLTEAEQLPGGPQFGKTPRQTR